MCSKTEYQVTNSETVYQKSNILNCVSEVKNRELSIKVLKLSVRKSTGGGGGSRASLTVGHKIEKRLRAVYGVGGHVKGLPGFVLKSCFPIYTLFACFPKFFWIQGTTLHLGN